MSFIDYNFFPILFFLGWNILTTKQFRPTTSNTSDSTVLPVSAQPLQRVFSSTRGAGFNQKVVKADLKRTKKIRRITVTVLEFVSRFQFLSENQKSISKKTRETGFNSYNSTLQDRMGFYTNPLVYPCLSRPSKQGCGSPHLTIGVNQRGFNSVNFRRNQRLKIQPLLRLPNQKIYSLNKFQIALSFSKILQPSFLFNDNYYFNLPPKIDNSMFHYGKNEFESQIITSKTFDSNPFAKSNNENVYLDHYHLSQKNWYMKTQFFQHIAWNMKHKISSYFSDLNDLFYTTNLPIKNIHGATGSSTWQSSFGKDFPTKPSQGQNLIIYGGSWYYENLVLPPAGADISFLASELPLSGKLHNKLKFDIGIYSLAHKLSSVGFHNGNSEINIYPFKYNDSYRYNFQNMNLSNHPPAARDNGGFFLTEQDYIPFSRRATPNSKKFLNFQNPTFSKTYAPLFQPQGLNLLSFIYNSFLQITPNSIINPRFIAFLDPRSHSSFPVEEAINSSSLGETNSLIKQYPYSLKNPRRGRKINKTPVGVDPLYSELPVHGIHSNPYPWITQNAYNRWSTSNHLFTDSRERTSVSDSSLLPSFDSSSDYHSTGLPPLGWKMVGESEFLPVNGLSKPRTGETSTSLSDRQASSLSNQTKQWDSAGKIISIPPSINHEKRELEKKKSERVIHRKNSDSPPAGTDFTKKPSRGAISYIEKPSIFFSSFRHLPYFFMSETFSTKNVVFPKTNLSLFPCFSISSVSPKMAKNHAFTYMDLSVPKYSLFHDNVSNFASGFNPSEAIKWSSKQNPLQLLSGETSANHIDIQKRGNRVFSPKENTGAVEPWKGYLQHKSFNLKPLSTFVKKRRGYQTRLFSRGATPKKTLMEWSEPRGKFFQRVQSRAKIDLASMPKNTWKIFPPLFQPFTFRFIHLNLPRTGSSELFFRPITATGFKQQNPRRSGKKQLKSDFIKSPAETDMKPQVDRNCLFQTTSWNTTQKNFFRFPIPFYFSDFFGFFRGRSAGNENNQSVIKSTELINNAEIPRGDRNNKNLELYESAFSLSDFKLDDYQQILNNRQRFSSHPMALFGIKPVVKFDKKNNSTSFNEKLTSPQEQNSKIIVYAEKPLLKNRTPHGPPLKNQKESISLPSYLKNITNQNYQNLCPNNLNQPAVRSLYFVFWILFNKTLFIYLSLHYLRKFISFLGTEYIRNLFKIFVTMKFIDGNILSIIKTFQDFNFQLNQQNVIDIKVNQQLKNIKRN